MLRRQRRIYSIYLEYTEYMYLKIYISPRQQAIKEAEKNRRIKYKAQDEEREVIR